jgi:class 3 adenylate cyclase/tetratricopeptide (TPR) repeat protein
VECPSCKHPNQPEARFCQDCGERLEIACASCGTRLPARARFCIECGTPVAGAAPVRVQRTPELSPHTLTPHHLAERILRTKSSIEGERKQVTVLFVDIKESMSLAEEVDAERWHRILDGFFTILAEGVHRFEGSVNQFTGDGMMALFGAPLAHEDHAQRACYTALHLLDEIESYAEKMRREEGFNFSVRMGLNSGEVVVGTIGDDLRMDYTAQGHTVGLAKRMEALAPAGHALLTEATAELVRDWFDLEDLGSFTVKGVRDPVHVWQLEGVGRHRTRMDISLERGLTPFVGRTAELEALEEALTEAAAGRSRVVALSAEPGTGKSRLCHEFLTRVRARGIGVFTGHCHAHATQIPFLPVHEFLRSYWGIEDSDDPQAAREKIAGRLLLHDPGLKEALPLVLDFMGLADPKHPPPPLDPEPRHRLLYGALQKLVEFHSEREVGVIVLEDLHWIDEASEHFVEELVELLRSPSSRTLLVVNYRPEYSAPWLAEDHVREFRIAPLGREESAKVLESLLGDDAGLAPLAENILARAAGNPFFMEELVRALVEAGSLEGTRGCYRLVKPAEDVILPATVQSVVAARIDHLGDLNKSVLQAAAVLGKEFQQPVLARLLAVDEATLERALHDLEESGFLLAQELFPERIYAFRHPVTQEVAYGSQLRDARADLHAAAAKALTELYPDRLGENAVLLATHWEGAGDYLAAVKAGRCAAERALQGDAQESHRLWTKMRGLLGRLEETHETLLLSVEVAEGLLASGWRVASSEEDTDLAYAWGMECAERADNDRGRARLLAAYGGLQNFRGRVDVALDYYAKARALADRFEDFPFRVTLTGRCAYSNLLIGNLRESLAQAEEVATLVGVSERDPRIPNSDYIFMRGFRALPLTYLGELRKAAAIIDENIEQAQAHGEIGTLNSMRGFSVSNAWFLGDASRAMRAALAQLEFAERVGSPGLRVMAYDSLGIGYLLSRQWQESVRALETSLAISRESGVMLQARALVLANMAEAYRGVGDSERARLLAREAVEAAESHRTAMHACRANLFLGRVLVRGEDESLLDEAEGPLRRALEIVSRTGAKAYEPFVRMELAQLERRRGDLSGAGVELEKADRIFHEIGSSCCVEDSAAAG